MIGVAVREQDGINARYAARERLLAKVGGRVHEDRRPVLDRQVDSDGRVRRSRLSLEWQTLHWQPIIGTPCEVPLPRYVTRAFIQGAPAARLSAVGRKNTDVSIRP